MAPRLPKRTLQPQDLKDPQRVLEVLNPLSEVVSTALAGGVSLNNIRKVVVTAKVTPPDEWTPLALLNGATLYNNGSHDVPSVRWTPYGADYKGLLTRPAAGASFVIPFAQIPNVVRLLKPKKKVVCAATASYLAGSVDVDEDGFLYLSSPPAFPANGWVSLNNTEHDCAPTPPLWPKPVDVTLLGEGQLDYGTPALVLVLGATRPDRATCRPQITPLWETPLLGEGKTRERKLRILRLDGLEAGIEHDVRFLCLYE